MFLRFLLALGILLGFTLESQAQCEARFIRFPDTSLTAVFAVYKNYRYGETFKYNRTYNHVWDFGDGTQRSSKTSIRNVNHRFAQSGWYKVTHTLTAKSPNNTVECTDTYSLHIYVGTPTSQGCGIRLYTDDTITSNRVSMVDSGVFIPVIAPMPATGFTISNFGGYQNGPNWVSFYDSLKTSHNGGSFGISNYAPNNGNNRVCKGTQLINANDSIVKECIECKDVFFNSPYTLSVADQSQVNPNTGEVTLQMQVSANPPIGNTIKQRYNWLFSWPKLYTEGNGSKVFLPRPGVYHYRRSLYLDDTVNSVLNESVAAHTAWDSVVVPQTNTCSSGFEVSVSTYTPNRFSFVNRSSNLYALNTTSTFQWFFGDGDTSTAEYPVKFYNQYGIYNVHLVHEVKDPNGVLLCSDTASQDVVYSPNGAACTASFQVMDSLSSNFNLVVTNRSFPATNDTNYTINYLWDFGDGQTSSVAYPQHTYAVNGAYELCLTINATHKQTNVTCSSTYCDTVGLDSLGNVIFKNGQGFTLNVIGPGSVSVDEQELAAVMWEVYPNPATNILKVANIDFAQGDVDLKLLDIQGRLVKEEQLRDKAQLNVQSIKPGLYILHITQNGQSAFKRVEIR